MHSRGFSPFGRGKSEKCQHHIFFSRDFYWGVSNYFSTCCAAACSPSCRRSSHARWTVCAFHMRQARIHGPDMSIDRVVPGSSACLHIIIRATDNDRSAPSLDFPFVDNDGFRFFTAQARYVPFEKIYSQVCRRCQPALPASRILFKEYNLFNGFESRDHVFWRGRTDKVADEESCPFSVPPRDTHSLLALHPGDMMVPSDERAKPRTRI